MEGLCQPIIAEVNKRKGPGSQNPASFPKDKGEEHAAEKGNEQEGYQPEHRYGDQGWKAAKAGGGHRLQRGGQEQEEEEEVKQFFCFS